MNRLCLDTSAYSNFQRGHRQAAAHIDQGLDRRAQRKLRLLPAPTSVVIRQGRQVGDVPFGAFHQIHHLNVPVGLDVEPPLSLAIAKGAFKTSAAVLQFRGID